MPGCERSDQIFIITIHEFTISHTALDVPRALGVSGVRRGRLITIVNKVHFIIMKSRNVCRIARSPETGGDC